MPPQSTIKAPEYPALLTAAQGLQNLDRRTKGSVANLAVPTSLATLLQRWAYSQPTSTMEKAFGGLDLLGGGGDAATFIAAGLSKPKVIEALRRLTRGDSPEEVWRSTGVARHPTSGTPLEEIDDSGMRLLDRPGDQEDWGMERVISHPKLFDEKPSMRDIRFSMEEGTGGTHYPAQNKITVGDQLSDPEFLDTTGHEIQHAASKRDNLGSGGSPEEFGAERYINRAESAKRSALGTLTGMEKLGLIDPAQRANIIANLRAPETHLPEGLDATTQERLTKALKGWGENADKYKEAYQTYRDLPDEALARLTAGRRQLTGGERLEDYPFDPAYFERLTKSKLENLKDPRTTPGDAVSRAIGPLYRGAQDIETLESGNYFSPDPKYASTYTEVMGKDWDKAAERPAMGKYELPNEGHIDLSKDPDLRKKFTSWASGDELDTTHGLEGDLPHFEYSRDFEDFLNQERPDWTSFKIWEPGDVPYSYVTRRPDIARNLLAEGLRKSRK